MKRFSVYSIIQRQINDTQAEDGREECIEDFKGEGNCARLVIVFNSHCHHVQEDQHKNGDLEPASI